MDIIKEYLTLIIPFLVITIGLIIYCVYDLFTTDRSIKGNKNLWLIVILFINPFGVIAYLLFGKGD